MEDAQQAEFDQLLQAAAPVETGQTVGEVIDAALTTVNAVTLKSLIDYRYQSNITTSKKDAIAALPEPPSDAQITTLKAFASDGSATDQWHDYLRTANEALRDWAIPVKNADPSFLFKAYILALVSLHKSTRKAVPSAEVT